MAGILLSDYLTKRENRKIDKILDKAAKRRKKKEGDTAEAFLFIKCPMQCKPSGDIAECHPECWENSMSKLLESIWAFCQANECCKFIIFDPDENEVFEDELPFDRN